MGNLDELQAPVDACSDHFPFFPGLLLYFFSLYSFIHSFVHDNGVMTEFLLYLQTTTPPSKRQRRLAGGDIRDESSESSEHGRWIFMK